MPISWAVLFDKILPAARKKWRKEMVRLPGETDTEWLLRMGHSKELAERLPKDYEEAFGKKRKK